MNWAVITLQILGFLVGIVFIATLAALAINATLNCIEVGKKEKEAKLADLARREAYDYMVAEEYRSQEAALRVKREGFRLANRRADGDKE